MDGWAGGWRTASDLLTVRPWCGRMSEFSAAEHRWDQSDIGSAHFATLTQQNERIQCDGGPTWDYLGRRTSDLLILRFSRRMISQHHATYGVGGPKSACAARMLLARVQMRPVCPVCVPSLPSAHYKLGRSGLAIFRLGRSGDLRPDLSLQMTISAQFAEGTVRCAQFGAWHETDTRCMEPRNTKSARKFGQFRTCGQMLYAGGPIGGLMCRFRPEVRNLGNLRADLVRTGAVRPDGVVEPDENRAKNVRMYYRIQPSPFPTAS